MTTVPNKHVWDFSNVSEGSEFNTRRKPAGDYKAKVVKWTPSTSKSGNAQWVYTFALADDPRATYPYYVGLDEKSAWKMRALLAAVGVSVPKKRAAVPGERPVGKWIGITLEDDEYDGRPKSVVQAVFPADDLDTGTEEEAEEAEEEYEEPEEEPAPRKRTATKKSPAKKAPARRQTEPEDDDDLDELDLDEL